LPAYASLSGEKARENLIRLGQNALGYVFWGSIGALFLYWLNAEFILELWLGKAIDDELLSLTRLLTLWWLLTSVNLPAWWLGMGLNSVWVNTALEGTHFIYSIGLVGLTWVASIEVFTVVFLWVLGGIGTHILLFAFLEKNTKLIIPMYFSRKGGILSLAISALAGATTLGHYLMVSLKYSSDITFLFSVLIFYVPLIVFFLADNKKWRHAW